MIRQPFYIFEKFAYTYGRKVSIILNKEVE